MILSDEQKTNDTVSRIVQLIYINLNFVVGTLKEMFCVEIIIVWAQYTIVGTVAV